LEGPSRGQLQSIRLIKAITFWFKEVTITFSLKAITLSFKAVALSLKAIALTFKTTSLSIQEKLSQRRGAQGYNLRHSS